MHVKKGGHFVSAILLFSHKPVWGSPADIDLH